MWIAVFKNTGLVAACSKVNYNQWPQADKFLSPLFHRQHLAELCSRMIAVSPAPERSHVKLTDLSN